MSVGQPNFLGDSYTVAMNSIPGAAQFGRTSGGVWLPMLVNSSGAVAVADSLAGLLSRATINITTATTTAVVSATAGQTTKVYRVMLNFAASQTLDIRSASTSLVGAAMSFGASGGLILDLSDAAWFTTVANEALNFVTSTTGAVTGFIDYIKD